MADIFISYAQEDGERARTLAEALEQQGWSVWWDPDIQPGETWDDIIERELDAALCVTVLWSQRSIVKKWVREEATEGLDRSILVPALIEDVRPPLGFRHVQAASLIDWNGEEGHRGFQRLLNALTAKLGKPASPPSQASKPAAAKEPAKPAPVAKKQPKSAARPVAKKQTGPEDLSDLAVFRDVDEPWCPEMVVLPAGEFMMGSPDSDKDSKEYEKPQDKVTIGYRLAVGRYPLTVAEYSRFVEATSRKHEGGIYCYKEGEWGNDETKSWRDPGFAQSDSHPVVGVSWEDATAYVEWLGRETGKPYRLLSEAEWEYGCRAATITRYFCGDTIAEKDANFDMNAVKTTEVGSYPANPWGLCDLFGNVWQWVEDVWHDTYKGAPDDGSAWTMNGDQDIRVVRGSGNLGAGCLRSAPRSCTPIDGRIFYCGFRVARTL